MNTLDKLACKERRLILASASPRRRELLAQLGLMFEVRPADVDEVVLSNEAPHAAAARLADLKAMTLSEQEPEALLLAADTVVALPSENNETWEILGKPEDFDDAVRMLTALQGRSHLVVTGVSLRCHEAGYSSLRSVETEVLFRAMSEADVANYVRTGECFDKAGAYGIQGMGGVFVSEIRGSYSNVVGLPLSETSEELMACGMWSTEMFPTRI